MKYRKKPVEIEAWQHIPFAPMPEWVLEKILRRDGDTISIFTLEGAMRADPGDWIIRGIKGEVYPCKPDIFEATYEPVEAS